MSRKFVSSLLFLCFAFCWAGVKRKWKSFCDWVGRTYRIRFARMKSFSRWNKWIRNHDEDESEFVSHMFIHTGWVTTAPAACPMICQMVFEIITQTCSLSFSGMENGFLFRPSLFGFYFPIIILMHHIALWTALTRTSDSVRCELWTQKVNWSQRVRIRLSTGCWRWCTTMWQSKWGRWHHQIVLVCNDAAPLCGVWSWFQRLNECHRMRCKMNGIAQLQDNGWIIYKITSSAKNDKVRNLCERMMQSASNRSMALLQFLLLMLLLLLLIHATAIFAWMHDVSFLPDGGFHHFHNETANMSK